MEWKRVLEEALAREDGVDEEAAGRALEALEEMKMTFDLLAKSGIGKAITKLRKSQSSLAARAKAIYEQWKALAA